MPDLSTLIARLPEVAITEPTMKHDGVFIEAALVEGKGKQVFIETVYGPNVPEQVYTLNIGGRGALVFAEQQFRDILASMLKLYQTNAERAIKQ